ncbi:MAG: winged helix-turn-helix domain-containing protein, partial [Cellulomonas sp.]|jgi:DNA-binding response OmpR family regulator|nr:winged helix-turn-helix domain-containing protein [Cellulomonas sp.]
VLTAGREVALTGRETALLAYLAAAGDRAVTREELLDAVWHSEAGSESRTVDVHVRRVRQKTGLAELIATVWGSGYRLDPHYRVRLAA